ncbi:hypothetical protein KPL39_02080 [Clostridium gasigenes]|uniref:hypothetical protein n=1 Tax=Clostridium gasigenes TaxID=94869 RepID=UPI001C0BE830|nr:hypothetical protein [Clostridium gasigenes]MBU3135049.1 hypothetical protein [Clostridium gasigenes]
MIKIDIDKLSKILEGLKLISNNIVDLYNCESYYENKDGKKVKVVQIDNTWVISNNM